MSEKLFSVQKDPFETSLLKLEDIEKEQIEVGPLFYEFLVRRKESNRSSLNFDHLFLVLFLVNSNF